MSGDSPADPDADVARLFDRFAGRLAQVAQRNLDRRLAGRIDGEDVVQSAFRTFFRRSARGEFAIESSSEMWRLLVHITIRKARAKGRYHTAAKRDALAEVSLQNIGDLLRHEPGPDEAVALVDLIETLLEGLPAWYGDALHKRLEQRSVSEIADELRISRQSVHRAFRLLQQRLDREVGWLQDVGQGSGNEEDRGSV
jgi:RNA polymerase sigma-70 factor (ECF subfamily)